MGKVTFRNIHRKCVNHVRVEVRGIFAEKFINICLKRNIEIWDVKKCQHNCCDAADKNATENSDRNCVSESIYHVTMSVSDFKHKIRPIALKTKCRAHVLSRGGLGITVKRYRKRIPLAVGALAVAGMVIFLFSLLWTVEVISPNGDDVASANEILKNMGIIPGISLKTIDVKDVSETLSSNIEGVEWAGVKIEGTKLVVTLSDGTYVEGAEIDPETPCDVVAAKDALITKIVVEQGTVVASEQAVILEGETIISGVVLPINEFFGTEEHYTHAKGKVTGIVRYSAYEFIENEVEVQELTGNVQENKKLLIFGFKIPLPWCKMKGAYEHYDSITAGKYIQLTDKIKIPIGIETETVIETEFVIKSLTDEEARSYAEVQALTELDGKLAKGAEIVDTGYEVRMIDGREAFYVWAECIEEIGVARRME